MFSNDELCSLRWDPVSEKVEIIDQTLLPHTLRWCHLDSMAAFCHAISSMQVRGAPRTGWPMHCRRMPPMSTLQKPLQPCWQRVPRR